MYRNEKIFDDKEEYLFCYKDSEHDIQKDPLLGKVGKAMIDKSGACDDIQEKNFSEVARTVQKSFLPSAIDLESDEHDKIDTPGIILNDEGESLVRSNPTDSCSLSIAKEEDEDCESEYILIFLVYIFFLSALLLAHALLLFCILCSIPKSYGQGSNHKE